ncbi:hypothetical protein QO058_04505 [Bosea vestrisii]|uniref:hypothetical protein n=1 Tax=Bosea vestrisii TaxID=151416 RepID=UPI0024DF91F5|nr:hypothetical protein [Bosea vestrisii]WID97534.1 hypothetical protein QO058_04505 [Bosea vestrisii]
MFNEIVIRRGIRSDGSFDAGLLAETLLFYENPLIVLDRGSLVSMIKSIGKEETLALLDENGLKISYMQEMFSTMSQTENGLRVHRFAEFKATDPNQRRRDGHGEIEAVLTRALGASRETRQFVKRLNGKAAIHRLRAEEVLGIDIASAATAELDNEGQTEANIRAVVSQLIPGHTLPSHNHFRAIRIDDKSFVLDTNIDFDHLNIIFPGHVNGESGTLTREYLINNLFEARADAYLCGQYMAPYVTSPVGHELMRRRLVELVSRRTRDVRELDLFQELLPEGRRVREVVNSGERTFPEVLDLLKSARRFKGWLRDKNPDQSLVAEYTTAITAQGWAAKLPSKSMRWVFMTGLGAAIDALYPASILGTATAQGISALDAMLLDRLLKGWKPDRFVSGELSEFVRGSIAEPVSPRAFTLRGSKHEVTSLFVAAARHHGPVCPDLVPQDHLTGLDAPSVEIEGKPRSATLRSEVPRPEVNCRLINARVNGHRIDVQTV